MGRFRGEIAQGRACAVWVQVDAPLASYGSSVSMECVTSAQLPASDLQNLLLRLRNKHNCAQEACGLIRGRPCRRRSRLRRLGQSRRFQGTVDTSSEDIGGRSARLLERHRQVEAFGPGDAAIAQGGFASGRCSGVAVWLRATRCSRAVPFSAPAPRGQPVCSELAARPRARVVFRGLVFTVPP